MSKEQFINLMKTKADEINSISEKNSTAGKRLTIKPPKKTKLLKDFEDLEEENQDDAGDAQINEEFKDVIRGVKLLFLFSNKELLPQKN